MKDEVGPSHDAPVAPCPCGLAASYQACCGRFHAGPLAGQAPDPEALMRSRYTAFVMDVRAYLLDTWHVSERPLSIDAPETGLKWLGLTVKRAPPPQGDRGQVDFVARYKIGGRAHRIEEVSDFLREGGRWYYLKAASSSEAP